MAQTALAPVPVTFISSHAHAGGSERYLELLVGEIGDDWIRGIVALEEGAFADRLRELGHRVDVVPTPARIGMVPAALRLRRVLLRQRPAVVHANGIKAALVAAMATLGTRIPVIWLKHDVSWDGRLARLVARRCAEVVAVSEAITTTFSGRLARRVRVVPNGIAPVDVDRPAARAAVAALAGGEGNAPVVALVGRLDPAKGQLDLIEAAPAVLERVPRARFLIVGGEDRYQPGFGDRLRLRAAELGVDDSVVFAGQRLDAVELIAGSDALALPSHNEGFGLAALEAMAAGTPVVAYSVGGLPDTVGDCGALVPVGDRDGLAAAIVAAIDSDGDRGRMVDCGRRRVEERFGLDAMVAAMRERYVAVARG